MCTHDIHTLTTCHPPPPPSSLILPLPGAPSSSSSFISPSTTAFSADGEQSTESAEAEETTTEMEAEPEPTLQLPPPAAAATAGSTGVMATVEESRVSVGGEHQSDPEEEQQQHMNRESVTSHIDPGFLSLSDPGRTMTGAKLSLFACSCVPPNIST